MVRQYTVTVTEYEQSDFDRVKENMTAEEAMQILEGLPRGWFPYKMPEWSKNVKDYDLDNYRTCCAIWFAIDALKRLEGTAQEEKDGKTD